LRCAQFWFFQFFRVEFFWESGKCVIVNVLEFWWKQGLGSLQLKKKKKNPSPWALHFLVGGGRWNLIIITFKKQKNYDCIGQCLLFALFTNIGCLTKFQQKIQKLMLIEKSICWVLLIEVFEVGLRSSLIGTCIPIFYFLINIDVIFVLKILYY
jgi:hypothetical protein